MKKLNFTILILLILAIPIVYSDTIDCGDRCGFEICQYMIEEKNLTVGKVMPEYSSYSNERFNVETLDGQVVGSVIIQNKVFVDIRCEHIRNPTYIVRIKDMQTIYDIYATGLDGVDEKISDGDLEINGVNFGKKMKMFFTRSAIKIGSWFS